MTKERLKELIKQHGIVYARKDNKIIEINLETCVIDDNCLLVGYDLVFDDCEDCYDISRLYETREQAEWSLKMQAERTERFEPPMWEEIPNFGGFYRFVFSHNNHYTSFNVNKDRNHIGIAIDLVSTYEESATKENYEKACEIVKELLVRGGAKND